MSLSLVRWYISPKIFLIFLHFRQSSAFWGCQLHLHDTCEELPLRWAVPAVVAVVVRRTTRPRDVYPGRGWGLQTTPCRARWHECHVFSNTWQGPCQRLLLFGAVQVVAQVLEWGKGCWSHTPLFVTAPFRLGSRWGHSVNSALHIRSTAACFCGPETSATLIQLQCPV